MSMHSEPRDAGAGWLVGAVKNHPEGPPTARRRFCTVNEKHWCDRVPTIPITADIGETIRRNPT